MHVQERYHCLALAANSTTVLPNNVVAVAFFAATVTGTIQISTYAGVSKLDTFPVTAGNVYKLPIITGCSPTVVLAGGAAGTIGYDS